MTVEELFQVLARNDGDFDATEESFKALRDELSGWGAITFSYSFDKRTSYVVTISKPKIVGRLSFGGNPHGSYMVSILRAGSFWADLSKKSEAFHPEYVNEKIGWPEKSDNGKNIAPLLNGLRAAAP